MRLLAKEPLREGGDEGCLDNQPCHGIERRHPHLPPTLRWTGEETTPMQSGESINDARPQDSLSRRVRVGEYGALPAVYYGGNDKDEQIPAKCELWPIAIAS